MLNGVNGASRLDYSKIKNASTKEESRQTIQQFKDKVTLNFDTNKDGAFDLNEIPQEYKEFLGLVDKELNTNDKIGSAELFTAFAAGDEILGNNDGYLSPEEADFLAKALKGESSELSKSNSVNILRDIFTFTHESITDNSTVLADVRKKWETQDTQNCSTTNPSLSGADLVNSFRDFLMTNNPSTIKTNEPSNHFSFNDPRFLQDLDIKTENLKNKKIINLMQSMEMNNLDPARTNELKLESELIDKQLADIKQLKQTIISLYDDNNYSTQQPNETTSSNTPSHIYDNNYSTQQPKEITSLNTTTTKVNSNDNNTTPSSVAEINAKYPNLDKNSFETAYLVSKNMLTGKIETTEDFARYTATLDELNKPFQNKTSSYSNNNTPSYLDNSHSNSYSNNNTPSYLDNSHSNSYSSNNKPSYLDNSNSYSSNNKPSYLDNSNSYSSNNTPSYLDNSNSNSYSNNTVDVKSINNKYKRLSDDDFITASMLSSGINSVLEENETAKYEKILNDKYTSESITYAPIKKNDTVLDVAQGITLSNSYLKKLDKDHNASTSVEEYGSLGIIADINEDGIVSSVEDLSLKAVIDLNTNASPDGKISYSNMDKIEQTYNMDMENKLQELNKYVTELTKDQLENQSNVF